MSTARALQVNILPFRPRPVRKNDPSSAFVQSNRSEDPILLKILASPVNSFGIISHIFVDWETQVLQDGALDSDWD